MIKDKQKGCLYGLAIGDALGAPIEFSRPGQFEHVTGYRDGGAFKLKAGQWTDDTSMALALADSIATVGWNLDDQARRYLSWYKTDKYSVVDFCFDIGNQTRRSLDDFASVGSVSEVLRNVGETANTNGSIMRLAPVPIAYHYLFPDYIEKLAGLAKQSSDVTHPSQQCEDSCAYLALIIAGLINGEERDAVLSEYWFPLKEVGFCDHVEKITLGSFKRKNPPDISGNCWAIDCLEAALWAFYHASDFEEAVYNAVNLGDDSDTTGAVCGQIAGAYWGFSGIPQHLIDGLDRKDMIDHAVNGLLGVNNDMESAYCNRPE